MRTACVLVVAFSVAAPAHAQSLGFEPVDTIDLPFDHAELRLTTRLDGADTFGTSSYRTSSATLSGALPLYGGDHLTGWRLLVQLRLGGERIDTTLPRDQTVIEDSAGLTALYVSQRDDLYALYAGVAIAESTMTLSSPSPMPTAIGLGSYHSGSLTWIYGGGFGYALGRSWLLPVGGVEWRASSTWTLSTLLPIDAEVRHRFGTDFALSLVASIWGDGYHIANDGAFPGASGTLGVRVGELELGVKARYRVSSRWKLFGELGVLGPRILEVVDGNTTDSSESGHGTIYFATGVSYAFDHSDL